MSEKIPRIADDLWVIPMGPEPFDKEKYLKEEAERQEQIRIAKANGTYVEEERNCGCCCCEESCS